MIARGRCAFRDLHSRETLTQGKRGELHSVIEQQAKDLTSRHKFTGKEQG